MNEVFNKKKNIAVLGSTGSIGTQTLDIISEYPDLFHASVLTANNNWELLARQAQIFRPEKVVIANEKYYRPLKEALAEYDVEVSAGDCEIASAVALRAVDMVVTAMVGYSGLLPTVAAINAGKKIALANKETLVVAGKIITDMLKSSASEIIPVDSEHSAIFQCLVGESTKQARNILLTASGGPFRKLTKDKLEYITVRDALNHPNWNMGAKVTIDSASMMNKGFEMIEAHWLFGCPPENIKILVHPQSIVHSMVEFSDGSIKAQLGVHDMRLPIRYALGYPERLPSDKQDLTLSQFAELTFEEPDYSKFPLLTYAFEAIARGGNMPCILNAANECAVAAFLKEKIRFTDMPKVADYTMSKCAFINNPVLEDLVATHRDATAIAQDWIERNS